MFSGSYINNGGMSSSSQGGGTGYSGQSASSSIYVSRNVPTWTCCTCGNKTRGDTLNCWRCKHRFCRLCEMDDV